jgi:hypothetical protein
MLNMSGADALISCWDDKAQWSFWRPTTAIRQGDLDGNPKTEADPTWTALSGLPSYPDPPSGYNCITGAFMHTAADFFGAKPLTFDMVRIVAGEPNQTRTYRQFTDVIDDTIDARVYIAGSTSERRTSRSGDRQGRRTLAGSELLPAGEVTDTLGRAAVRRGPSGQSRGVPTVSQGGRRRSVGLCRGIASRHSLPARRRRSARRASGALARQRESSGARASWCVSTA